MIKKITILYVDDEEINLMLLSKNFSRRNFEVITALSGEEGLKKLNEIKNIKFIISDMRMPRMNGLEFIKKVRLTYPEVICFILTGFEYSEEIEEAIDKNIVNQYFCKPFEIDEMINVMQSYL